jgi:zinc D-Ala-D-Ala carboxypeptidase
VSDNSNESIDTENLNLDSFQPDLENIESSKIDGQDSFGQNLISNNSEELPNKKDEYAESTLFAKNLARIRELKRFSNQTLNKNQDAIIKPEVNFAIQDDIKTQEIQDISGQDFIPINPNEEIDYDWKNNSNLDAQNENTNLEATNFGQQKNSGFTSFGQNPEVDISTSNPVLSTQNTVDSTSNINTVSQNFEVSLEKQQINKEISKSKEQELPISFSLSKEQAEKDLKIQNKPFEINDLKPINSSNQKITQESNSSLEDQKIINTVRKEAEINSEENLTNEKTDFSKDLSQKVSNRDNSEIISTSKIPVTKSQQVPKKAFTSKKPKILPTIRLGNLKIKDKILFEEAENFEQIEILDEKNSGKKWQFSKVSLKKLHKVASLIGGFGGAYSVAIDGNRANFEQVFNQLEVLERLEKQALLAIILVKALNPLDLQKISFKNQEEEQFLSNCSRILEHFLKNLDIALETVKDLDNQTINKYIFRQLAISSDSDSIFRLDEELATDDWLIKIILAQRPLFSDKIVAQTQNLDSNRLSDTLAVAATGVVATKVAEDLLKNPKNLDNLEKFRLKKIEKIQKTIPQIDSKVQQKISKNTSDKVADSVGIGGDHKVTAGQKANSISFDGDLKLINSTVDKPKKTLLEKFRERWEKLKADREDKKIAKQNSKISKEELAKKKKQKEDEDEETTKKTKKKGRFDNSISLEATDFVGESRYSGAKEVGQSDLVVESTSKYVPGDTEELIQNYDLEPIGKDIYDSNDEQIATKIEGTGLVKTFEKIKREQSHLNNISSYADILEETLEQNGQNNLSSQDYQEAYSSLDSQYRNKYLVDDNLQQLGSQLYDNQFPTSSLVSQNFQTSKNVSKDFENSRQNKNHQTVHSQNLETQKSTQTYQTPGSQIKTESNQSTPKIPDNRVNQDYQDYFQNRIKKLENLDSSEENLDTGQGEKQDLQEVLEYLEEDYSNTVYDTRESREKYYNALLNQEEEIRKAKLEGKVIDPKDDFDKDLLQDLFDLDLEFGAERREKELEETQKEFENQQKLEEENRQKNEQKAEKQNYKEANAEVGYKAERFINFPIFNKKLRLPTNPGDYENHGEVKFGELKNNDKKSLIKKFLLADKIGDKRFRDENVVDKEELANLQNEVSNLENLENLEAEGETQNLEEENIVTNSVAKSNLGKNSGKLKNGFEANQEQKREQKRAAAKKVRQLAIKQAKRAVAKKAREIASKQLKRLASKVALRVAAGSLGFLAPFIAGLLIFIFFLMLVLIIGGFAVYCIPIKPIRDPLELAFTAGQVASGNVKYVINGVVQGNLLPKSPLRELFEKFPGCNIDKEANGIVCPTGTVAFEKIADSSGKITYKKYEGGATSGAGSGGGGGENSGVSGVSACGEKLLNDITKIFIRFEKGERNNPINFTVTGLNDKIFTKTRTKFSESECQFSLTPRKDAPSILFANFDGSKGKECGEYATKVYLGDLFIPSFKDTENWGDAFEVFHPKSDGANAAIYDQYLAGFKEVKLKVNNKEVPLTFDLKMGDIKKALADTSCGATTNSSSSKTSRLSPKDFLSPLKVEAADIKAERTRLAELFKSGKIASQDGNDVTNILRSGAEGGFEDNLVLLMLKIYDSGITFETGVSNRRPPGTLTTSGNVSNHSTGTAVDFTSFMRGTQWKKADAYYLIPLGGLNESGKPGGKEIFREVIKIAKATGTVKPGQILSPSGYSDIGVDISDDAIEGSGALHIAVLADKKFDGSGTTSPTTTSGSDSLPSNVVCCPPNKEGSSVTIETGKDETAPKPTSTTETGDKPKNYAGITQAHRDFIAKLAKESGYSLQTSDGGGILPDAQKAFDERTSAAKKDGLNLEIASGYRSREDQVGVFFSKIDTIFSGNPNDPKVTAAYLERMRLSAPPGYSEHQTGKGKGKGKGIDIVSQDPRTKDLDPQKWIGTATEKWLADNSGKYGFRITYKKDRLNSTKGTTYEPWHLFYTGTKSGFNSPTLDSKNNLAFDFSKIFKPIETQAQTKISATKITELENLEKAGKVKYEGGLSGSGQAREGALQPITVDMLIALGNKYESISITSLRRYGGGESSHNSGYAIDIGAVTINGKDIAPKDVWLGNSSQIPDLVKFAGEISASGGVSLLIAHSKLAPEILKNPMFVQVPQEGPDRSLPAGKVGLLVDDKLHYNHYHLSMKDNDKGKVNPIGSGVNDTGSTATPTGTPDDCGCVAPISGGGSSSGSTGTTLGSGSLNNYETAGLTRGGQKYNFTAEQKANIEKYKPAIEQYAKKYNIDPTILFAKILQESTFSTSIIKGTERSSVGAVGISQFLPSTLESTKNVNIGGNFANEKINPGYSVEDILSDPNKGIEIQARYLRFLLNKFGNDNWLGVAAYNVGEGSIERNKDLRSVGGSETRNYVIDVDKNSKLLGGPGLGDSKYKISYQSLIPQTLANEIPDSSSFQNLPNIFNPVQTFAQTSTSSSETKTENKLDLAKIASQTGVQSIVVQDLATGKIQSYNGNKTPEYGPASTIKTVVVDSVLQKVKSGQIKLDDTITIPEELRALDSADSKALPDKKGKTTWTVKEAIAAALGPSSNTATNALVYKLSGSTNASAVNPILSSSGYPNTRFNNFLNLKDAEPKTAASGGNSSNALEITKALSNLNSGQSSGYDLARKAMAGGAEGYIGNQNDPISKGINGYVLGKAGSTSKVTGNTAIVEVNGKKYIVTTFVEKAQDNPVINTTNQIATQLKAGSTLDPAKTTTDSGTGSTALKPGECPVVTSDMVKSGGTGSTDSKNTGLSDLTASCFPVTIPYEGPGPSQSYGYARGRLHAGVDFTPPASISDAEAENSPILAFRAGKVTSAGGGHNTIVIDHTDGTASRYLHNSKILVKAGDTIKPCQEIAKMGGIGSGGTKVYPVHLHFELYTKSGDLVDPATIVLDGKNPKSGLKTVGSPKSSGGGL